MKKYIGSCIVASCLIGVSSMARADLLGNFYVTLGPNVQNTKLDFETARYKIWQHQTVTRPQIALGYTFSALSLLDFAVEGFYIPKLGSSEFQKDSYGVSALLGHTFFTQTQLYGKVSYVTLKTDVLSGLSSSSVNENFNGVGGAIGVRQSLPLRLFVGGEATYTKFNKKNISVLGEESNGKVAPKQYGAYVYVGYKF